MAVRSFIGFGRYTNLFQASSRNGWVCNFSQVIGASDGRNSSRGASVVGGGGSLLERTMSAANNFFYGAAMAWSNGAGAATIYTNGQVISQVRDGATAQLSLIINSDNTVSVRRGDGAGTELGRSVATVWTVANVFNYIEWGAVIDNAAGSFEVRYNGATILSASGVDTQNTANASYTVLVVCNGNTSGINSFNSKPFRFDDIYVSDNTGSAPGNTFLGDCRIDFLQPTSTVQAQWTRNTGATNHEALDDIPAGTADFIHNNSAAVEDIYGFSDLPGSATRIFGIIPEILLMRNNIVGNGASLITPKYYINGTPYAQSALRLVNAVSDLAPVTASPASGTLWTTAEINGLQVGLEAAAAQTLSRFWRIFAQTTTSGNVHFAEIEMASSAGGADLCSGGTASASRADFSTTAANAFDNNNANIWGAQQANTGQWIAYTFASAVNIAEVRCTLPDTVWAVNDAPQTWRLQWSPDGGTTWVDKITAQGLTTGWARNATRTFTAADVTATHTRWRIWMFTQPLVVNYTISELEMADSIGGADLCTGGTPTASAASGGAAANAFDDNTSTNWQTASSSVNQQWLGYTFASPVNIAEARMRSRIDNSSFAFNDSPTGWALQCSPDGTIWTTRFVRAGDSGWTNNEVRTVSSASPAAQVDVLNIEVLRSSALAEIVDDGEPMSVFFLAA